MKKIYIKIYDQWGNFKTVWDDAELGGFTKQMFGGLGSCVIELGKNYDYSGDDLQLNNEVKVYIHDEDLSAGETKLIYDGYIYEYEPWIDKGDQGIRVTLMGYYTTLSLDIYQVVADKMTTITESAVATSVMVKNLIDRYRAARDNPKIEYTQQSIEVSGDSKTYTFEAETYREALDKIVDIAPIGWYYYVDADGVMNFKQVSTTTDHTFIVGRHCQSARIYKNMGYIRNIMLAWDRDTNYKLYQRQNSVDRYGRRIEKRFDAGFQGNVTTMDSMAEKFLQQNEEPRVKIIAEIIDNNESDKGYDIDNVEPGDTCIFRGFEEGLESIFNQTMLISKVDYSLDKITITVEPVESGILFEQRELGRSIGQIASEGVQTAYEV